MYDSIIVGARVAGAPTAMLLARAGHRVLLVDKASFPSDTMSTHFIQGPGVAALKRWGLLDRLVATGCPPITGGLLDLGGFTVPPPPPGAGDVEVSYCPRRTVLDKILVDAAVEAGAELREGFSVQDILFDDDPTTPGQRRVTGIRGRTRDGSMVVEEARIVIGADGKHSRVAHAVGAPEYEVTPSLTCGYYSYWSGVEPKPAGLFVRDHRCVLAFPTNDDLVCVAAIWPHAEFHAFRAAIEDGFMQTLELAPTVAGAVRGGTRVERWMGMSEAPNYFRRPYGPGWALAGDAGYLKDPIMGSGITDAFRDAEFLAGAIDAGLSGALPMEEALAGHEHRRNEAAMPAHRIILALAALKPVTPARVRLILGAMGGAPVGAT